MDRVVVGVDGSDTAVRALDAAADQAAAFGCPLLVVAAWSAPGRSFAFPVSFDPAEFEGYATETAEDTVDRVVARHPDLAVSLQTIEGDARTVLVDTAGPDDLLVVGSQGSTGVIGMMLGSVASHCVNHARGPILVLPSPDDHDDGRFHRPLDDD